VRAVDVIRKKRNGEQLNESEIRFLIRGYASGEVTDYQMAAWAMAVYFNGMSLEETMHVTQEMSDSGDRLDLSSVEGVKVDKHSTGGVGDKTTLVVAPMVAALGVKFAKISGRGLYHAGGTIDKLESVHNFRSELNEEALVCQLEQYGLVVIGQSESVCPIDKKLYALRDVTATVDSLPLIASSIMSKKIATGANALVLDVKCGRGTFTTSLEESIELANIMVNIGKRAGLRTTAVVSKMDQPLGYAIGNSLELIEAIDALSGRGPTDLMDLSMEIASRLVVMADKAITQSEARRKLYETIHSGEALGKLSDLIAGQGGDPHLVMHPERLPQADIQYEVCSAFDGYVQEIDAKDIGLLVMQLGAGRSVTGCSIHYGVGVVLHKKCGDPVRRGEKIAVVHIAESAWMLRDQIGNRLRQAFQIGDACPAASPILLGVIE